MQQLWNCAKCHSLNEATTKRCYRCRADRATQEYIDPRGSPDGPGVAAIPLRDPSIFGALIFGMVAAVLATALWFWWDVNVPRGIFRMSWLVGLAIAIGVTLGGRGRVSFPIVLLSVLLTAAALVAGEYLLISWGLALARGVDTHKIVLADPKDVVAVLPSVLREVPLRPLLWVVALAAAFLWPWGVLVGSGKRGRAT
jgi:hypothetical protein